MELFELSTEFENVWNVFFLPVIRFAVVIVVIYFILGKNFFQTLHNSIVEFDGMYFKKKNGIYRPTTSMQKRIAQLIRSNNIFSCSIILLFIYATDKLIFWVAQLFPFASYYIPENLLLFSVDEDTIASLWSYCPGIPFSNLWEQISILSLDSDITEYYNSYTSDFIDIESLFMFILVLSIILFFVPKPQKKVKRLKKIFVTVLLSFFIITIAHLYNFSNIVHETEQKCYYVLNYYQLENGNTPEDNEAFENCLEKVKEQKSWIATTENNKVFGFTLRSSINFQKLYELIQEISYKM